MSDDFGLPDPPTPDFDSSWSGDRETKNYEGMRSLSARIRELENLLAPFRRDFFLDGEGRNHQALLAPSIAGTAGLFPWDIYVESAEDGAIRCATGEVRQYDSMSKDGLLSIDGKSATHNVQAGDYLVLTVTVDKTVELKVEKEWPDFPELYETEAAEGDLDVLQMKLYRYPLWAFVNPEEIDEDTSGPLRVVNEGTLGIRMAPATHLRLDTVGVQLGEEKDFRMIAAAQFSSTVGGWSK